MWYSGETNQEVDSGKESIDQKPIPKQKSQHAVYFRKTSRNEPARNHTNQN